MRLPDLIGKRPWPSSDSLACWSEIVHLRDNIAELMSHYLVVEETKVLCEAREVNGPAKYTEVKTTAQALHKRPQVEIRVSTAPVGQEPSQEVNCRFTLPPNDKMVQCVFDGLRLALMAKQPKDETVESELRLLVAEMIERGLFESVSVSEV
jgi:hypothetical protein